ncbi:MAG: hypothetical protein LQ338_007595 [Usnochroma carphineum]|nr:MAG: hypothetical protein LQ338_007595 [Usnochroma carphineum]
MTGLDVDNDEIISVCCFISDGQLDLVDDQGWEAVIHLDKSRLDAMGEWCVATHGASGLTAASIASTTTAEEAAEGLLAYIVKYIPKARSGVLAGNSVHADKAFLRKPPFNSVLRHLHHRIFDVSTLKEAAKRWAPPAVLDRIPSKQGLHQARADILESIAEARFYRHAFFIQGASYKHTKQDTPNAN